MSYSYLQMYIIESIFRGNSVKRRGGSVYLKDLDRYTIQIDDSLFLSNSARDIADSVYAE